MNIGVFDRVEEALGDRPVDVHPLSGGCVGDVYALDMRDGHRLVAKVDPGSGASLDIEGRMLQYLRERSSLPVPDVMYTSPDVLIMAFVETGGHTQGSKHDSEVHAADLLAALHAVRPATAHAAQFGLDFDTLIGGLHQPNPWTYSWIEFFREYRLLHMAREAMRAGRLPTTTFKNIEILASRLDTFIEEPDAPSLIHGDVWSGNVLTHTNRIAAFIDPAIYFAHREIELAFITMFNTFSDTFFDRYREHHPIRDGFFSERRDLYILYPLLVHARLFGGGYIASIQNTLKKYI